MPPKEPTRAQLSSRLQFQSHTPSFLRAFQAKVSGRHQDEDEPSYDNLDEYQFEGEEGRFDEFGRERRPALDEFGREIRREGSAEVERKKKMREDDEELDEERPQVVVLKEGKHLTEREAENERRKAKGLPPLADEDELTQNITENSSKPSTSTSATVTKATKSGVQMGSRNATKRKAPVGGREDDDLAETIRNKKEQKKKEEGGPPKKKVKKEKKGAQKGLLSFGDDG